MADPTIDPGLCARCVHAHRIVSKRGSVFWRCTVAKRVEGWPKYPPLPVLRCRHHTEGVPGGEQLR